MRTIIVLVFLVLAAAFLLDSFRKRGAAQRREDERDTGRTMNANDAPPTETGRLRVKHIVDALKKPGEAEAGGTSGVNDPDEVHKPEKATGQTLPDPFENK